MEWAARELTGIVDPPGPAMSTVEPRPNSLSLSFVEGLYADYLRDAESVSPDWRHYFEELSHAGSNGAEQAAAAFRPTFEPAPASPTADLRPPTSDLDPGRGAAREGLATRPTAR